MKGKTIKRKETEKRMGINKNLIYLFSFSGLKDYLKVMV